MSAATISVPHHRVKTTLHSDARARATSEKVSLSAVATAGLVAYSSAADDTVRLSAAENVKEGRLVRHTKELPLSVRDRLKSLSEHNDSNESTALLVALHLAGWSYRALAEPLGLTRQAIHSRVAEYEPVDDYEFEDLPTGPRLSTRATVAQADRFDWSIWIDRTIYAVAVHVAARRGDVMRDVMEDILTHYVDGSLVVVHAPVAQDADVHSRTESREARPAA